MRNLLLIAFVAIFNSGCLIPSLREHATNQSMSVTDMRYQEVLHNFAVVANNQGVLPSFAFLGTGAANVSNTISADANTAFSKAVNGFSNETLNVFGSHNPELQWTIDPVVGEPNLEALRYACMWVICGPPAEGNPAMELLRAPSREDIYGCHPPGQPPRPAGFHFDVASKLEMLPPRWLGIGCRRDVPRSACYQAHCGKTYVWVMPAGLEALSEFTLVILDIATVDPKSLVLPRPQATVQIPIDDTTPAGGTVTEQWNACQEANASGTVLISRPQWLRQLPCQVPEVLTANFTVVPNGPTPRIDLSK